MALITWNDSYSVKIKEMDNQHKKLIDLINTLHDAMKVGKGKEAVGEISTALVDYTKRHFSAEEMLMKLHDYPGYEDQKRAHMQLVSQIAVIQKKYEDGTVLSQDVITFLKNWLVNHIQGMDQKYGPYLIDKGVN
jgi:hemerythrin-like metal-binding protein